MQLQLLSPMLFFVGWMLSIIFTAIAIAYGTRFKALDSPGADGHLKQLRMVPNVGGVAVISAFVLPALAGLLYISLRNPPSVDPTKQYGLDFFHSRIEANFLPTLAILAGAVWLLLIGMWDDRKPMRAAPKLLLQFIPAIVIVWRFDIRLLTMLDHYGPEGKALSVFLGVIWIVAMINAMNFLDNMDGLASGVGMIASLLFATAAFMVHQWFIASMFSLLAGSLAGFLLFNFFPKNGAKIFLGDGGSQPLGFLLAVLAIRTTFVNPDQAEYELGTHWWGILAPLIILAIPIYDMIATSMIRLRLGHSPWIGDQRHLSHRLVERGFSTRAAVLIIWALAAIIGMGGILIGNLTPVPAILVVLQTIAALLLLGFMEGIFRR
ncbi:MAG: undecaprenyl/decaprenyl-phosphate alpha-N-acetylglucosaminyl 1-phosphate transferase [Planctomycetota bacterium]|nr:MAG: undecaprenyl/decaprenyl-phosphate alpha-N-acetylglucosaminyl 1-phosphate transferase [Planctomycetota bacterium]